MRRIQWAAGTLVVAFWGAICFSLGAQDAVVPTGEGTDVASTEAPMVADEVSRELLDQWEEKEYYLGRDGVNRGSLIMDCVTQSVFGRMSSRAQYIWEDGEGKLYWDDPQVGAMMERQGWSKDSLDYFFEGRSEDGNFGGCTLTAEVREGGTAVVVSGPTRVRELFFTSEGVLRKLSLEMPPGPGEQGLSMGFTLDYQRLNGHWIARGWTLEVELPEMGKLVQRTRVTVGREGRYHVIKQAQSETLLEGVKVAQMLVRFGNWRLEGLDNPVKPAP